MQFLLLRWAMPLSVIHVLPRELHSPVLILARGVIRVAIRAGHELLHRRNKIAGAAASFRMVGVEAKVWQDGAVGALRDLQRYAVPLAESALLPRSEDVEEAAHANHYAQGHCAPGPVIGACLRSHGLPRWIQGTGTASYANERQLPRRLRNLVLRLGGFQAGWVFAIFRGGGVRACPPGGFTVRLPLTDGRTVRARRGCADLENDD